MLDCYKNTKTNKFKSFFKKKMSDKTMILSNIHQNSRNILLTRFFLGKKLVLHNGKLFKTIFVNSIKLKTISGEYFLTRIKRKYKKKK